MRFEEIEKAKETYQSAIILDRVISRSRRKFVFSWSSIITGALFLAVAIYTITASFEPSLVEENAKVSFASLVGVFLIVFSFWIVSRMVDAFYFSNYFRSCISCLKSEKFFNRDSIPRITFEVAESIDLKYKNDLTGGFLVSSIGQYISLRSGLPVEDVRDFIMKKRVPVVSSECDFEPSGDAEMLTLVDFVRAILETDEEFVFFLASNGVSKDSFIGAVEWATRIEKAYVREQRFWSRDNLGRIPSIGKGWSYGGAYKLEKYAEDLTEGASNRSSIAKSLINDEVEEVESILSRGRESNALILGEEGGPKLDLIYELAKRIKNGNVLPQIEGKRIFLFRNNVFVSSMQDKQHFENELISMLDEAVRAGDVIVVFPNFSTLIQSAEQSLVNLLAVMEPFLNSSSLQVVALDTPSAFHANLEHNDKINKFFEKIKIEGKSSKAFIQTLEDVAIGVESEKRLLFTYSAISAIVESAERYFPEGIMPDKAIDLLYDIAPKIQDSGVKVVKREDVLSLIKIKTGIPTGKIDADEKEKLLNLEEMLHSRVVGQNDAISAISNAMRRARSGIGNPDRPMGSFLFLGPTGVGKTETTKALAEAFFKDKDAIIRVDMSEFRTEDSLERLIGSYSSKTPGILTSKLRDKPYGVLLLDEFEKTSQNVLDLFLQILDEGVFSDMDGKKVMARNLIIIATSNAGSDLIWNALGPNKSGELDKDALLKEIISRGLFKPELLNRFDGVIVFHPLDDGHIAKIARLMLEKLSKRLKEKGIELVITDKLIRILVKEGSDPAFGARPMNRAIQEKVEQAIAEKMIRGEIEAGSKVELTEEDLK